MHKYLSIIKSKIKSFIRFVIPLNIRKQISIFLIKQRWINNDDRNWWAMEIVSDFAKKNIDKYHQFLWEHHMGYAETYSVGCRFGIEKMHESRKMFFAHLETLLTQKGINPYKDIKSVFEVGCSLGYQLNYLEHYVFTNAQELDGIDIDKNAIHNGKKYLQTVGSKAHIEYGNMIYLDSILQEKKYDIILANGVLLYATEDIATDLVKIMLEHTKKVIGLCGLAHPEVDNKFLKESDVRTSDKTFIHNIDAMVLNANGRIIARRWDGAKLVNGHSIYFVFAKPINHN